MAHNRGMLKIAVTQTGADLAQLPAHIKAAIAPALTGLAFDVRDALREEMAQAFDKPNAFTLNAFRVAPATAASGEAVVWAMPRQASYLRPQIEGGDRGSKGFEHKLGLFGGRAAVPVGKFDAQFERSPKGFTGRMFRSMAAGKRNGFFAGTPKGGGRDGGVWMRAGRGGRQLLKVMSFEDNASYEERLDVQHVAERTAGLRWESQLLRVMAKA